jgi:hypothetical protein
MSTDITYNVLRKQNRMEIMNVFIKTLWFVVDTATLNSEKEKKLEGRDLFPFDTKTTVWFSFNYK